MGLKFSVAVCSIPKLEPLASDLVSRNLADRDLQKQVTILTNPLVRQIGHTLNDDFFSVGKHIFIYSDIL